MKRYVIQVDNKFIKWASIFSVEGEVSINSVGGYTNELNEAWVYSDSDKEEDMAAWEKFYDCKHGEEFEYKEIEFVFK